MLFWNIQEVIIRLRESTAQVHSELTFIFMFFLLETCIHQIFITSIWFRVTINHLPFTTVRFIIGDSAISLPSAHLCVKVYLYLSFYF